KALGETNLERKCRWLFGACLLPLIMGSFWWYGSQTDKIVLKQNRFVGEALVDLSMMQQHKDILGTRIMQMSTPPDEADIAANEALTKLLNERVFDGSILLPKNEQGIRQPTDTYEWALMDKWKNLGATLLKDEDIDALKLREDRPWEGKLDEKNTEYLYYQPVFAKKGCITCHNNPLVEVYWPDLQMGDLMAIVRVEMDASNTKRDQANNRAMLLVAAIATVFLAMVALYVVVRYLIVKPLRHLRDVSDSIRRGDVEQRAVIHTGDEFEELGAAFNRMLRQLLRQQDELRSVNSELDQKIDEMAQANMRLFEMNQLKSDFLATVSHELKTPLNSIIGFSDLLGSADGLEEKQLRYASNIQHSGKQLLDMINDILDLAKIESGKMDIRLSDFNIATVVATQCDMARPLSEKKNIDLEYEFAPDLPFMTQDQGKIEQILNNLLSNAIKFTPDGGRINVVAHRDRRGDLRLTVFDTGVGISESEQVLVFEKFRQGTTVLAIGHAMTREYSGTGLGLSIVRELCRLLGGDITLESELGKGSEFTVHLPWKLTELPRIESPLADELKQLTKPRPELPTVASERSE
ncbi:MAG: HAMP domain-containing protein, partial [Planctomycetes bacterium]|nr:HAMP domain-containing protein [Planctomycetota bacterium]